MSGAAPPWLITARVLRGTDEAPGVVDNPTIMNWPAEIARRWPELSSYAREYTHDSIAWCGLFAAYCVSANGIRPPSQFLWALNWSHWGTPVSDPKLGDVAVFHRDGGGHVAFFEELDGDHVVVTGGNQSDSVSTARYPRANLVGFFRPPAPEKLPAAGNIPEKGWCCGKGSWYSQLPPKWIDEGDRPNSNALGVPDAMQGIALYNRATLGQYFDVLTPDNRLFPHERQTDIGPHPNTGRKIDISAALAERMGYSPSNFPTDKIFKWRPAVADPVSTPTPAPSTDEKLDKLLELMNQKEVKQSFGAFAMVAIKAAQVAFPQFAVFGTLAQFLLSAAGFMGTPIGEAATTTGQVTGATLVSLLASWAVSKINKVAS